MSGFRNLLLCLGVVYMASCASVSLVAPQIDTKTLAKGTTSWDGKKLPVYPAGSPQATILKITIAPHTELPLHQHPFINAAVVLSGELTVITEAEDVLQVHAGEAFIEVVNKWHYGINDTDKPVELIVFYAGEEGEPITVKDNSVQE